MQFVTDYYRKVFEAPNGPNTGIDRNRLDEMMIALYKKDKRHTAYLFDALSNITEVYRIAISAPVMSMVNSCLGGQHATSFCLKNVGLRMDIPEPNWSEDFPWHQDFPYNKPFSVAHHSGTCWIPVFDCPAEVGPVKVETGSHKRGIIESHLDYKRGEHRNPLHVLEESSIDEEKVRQYPMQAGDLLIFDLLTAHCSGTNVSESSLRWTLIARYFDINADGFLQAQA